MAIYDSVNGVARKVTKMYDGVNGVARTVTKAYDSVGGVARLCFSNGVSWGKYSCNVVSSYYEKTSQENCKLTAVFLYSYQNVIFHDCNFNSDTGFYSNNYSVYQPTKDETLGSVKAILEGNYQYVGSDYATYVESVESVDVGDNGISVSFSATRFYANYYPSTYSKGSTSYGTVTAPKEELPEDGTLVEGSAADGYCVLLIGSTYYYYVLEDIQ